MPGPAAAQVERVAGVAGDADGVGGVAEVEDFQLCEREAVVAVAGQVDRFEAAELVVGDGGQIQVNAVPVQCEGVGAAAAVDALEGEVGDDDPVVALGSIDHVGSAAA